VCVDIMRSVKLSVLYCTFKVFEMLIVVKTLCVV